MIISSMPSTLSSPIKKLRSSLIWAWADKTVITLTALHDLILDSFEIRKVLVIAPLRVARNTWPAEVTKWDHLKGLTYSVAVGTEKERIEALMKRTHIHIINRENVRPMVSTVLVNILLGCFCLAVLSWVLVGVETFIHDRKREKREEESAKRDADYHLKRMEQMDK